MTEVWTDHIGIWHASVPLDTFVGPEAHAREAIGRAMLAHGEPSYRLARLAVTRERVTNHGTAVYAEVWGQGDPDEATERR